MASENATAGARLVETAVAGKMIGASQLTASRKFMGDRA